MDIMRLGYNTVYQQHINSEIMTRPLNTKPQHNKRVKYISAFSVTNHIVIYDHIYTSLSIYAKLVSTLYRVQTTIKAPT